MPFHLDTPELNLQTLRDSGRRLGFVDLGAVPLSLLGDILHPSLADTLPTGMTHALSLVTALSGAVLDSLRDRPTPLYGMHYQRINSWIDLKALDLVASIQGAGFCALPIPASQVVDRGSQRGHLMHKLVAVAAELGWIGRSNLFVTRNWGARVRLATILTDLPLSREGALAPSFTLPDEDTAEHCGSCRACIERCPAAAIGERREDFRLDRCAEKIASFQRLMFVTRGICGICQAACPGRPAEHGGGSGPEEES